MRKLHFSLIHYYLNFANVSWTTTYKSNLPSLDSLQKHPMRIIYDKKPFTPTKPLLEDAGILTVYEINQF